MVICMGKRYYDDMGAEVSVYVAGLEAKVKAYEAAVKKQDATANPVKPNAKKK